LAKRDKPRSLSASGKTVDEAKLINRQIAETRVEIAVCTRLKTNGIMMRLGKPVGDLLVAYEMKLVDLENQLQALSKKPAAKPGVGVVAKPAAPVTPKAPAPVSTKPPVPAAKPAPPIPRPVLVVKQVTAAAPAKPALVAPAKPVAAAPAKPAPSPAPAKAAVAKSAALEPKAAPRKATPSASKPRK
jgi:hypothetical protein